MSAVYGTISIIAFILIGICLLVDKNKNQYLLLLFISIFLANLGYFLISIAPSLNFALNANRLSYLGQVFLPYFLLMMLLTTVSYTHLDVYKRQHILRFDPEVERGKAGFPARPAQTGGKAVTQGGVLFQIFRLQD